MIEHISDDSNLDGIQDRKISGTLAKGVKPDFRFKLMSDFGQLRHLVVVHISDG